MILVVSIIWSSLFSCEDDDCTKMVNVPKWDQLQGTFVDNLQEVPCDADEPSDQPVGMYSE